MWVPKHLIISTADVPARKKKIREVVLGQRMLKAHDREQVYVLKP